MKRNGLSIVPVQWMSAIDRGEVDVARVPQQRGVAAFLVPVEACRRCASHSHSPLYCRNAASEEQPDQHVGPVREVAQETRGEHDPEEREQLDESADTECSTDSTPSARGLGSQSDHARHGRTASGPPSHGESGNVTNTVVPLPGSLRTDTSPSHMSTRLRTSVSPSPGPFEPVRRPAARTA